MSSVKSDKMWCRICLRGEGPLLPLNGAQHLQQKIMTCSTIQISDDEVLPSNICPMCVENLNVAHNFKTQCESSDKKLKSYLKVKKNSKFTHDELMIFLSKEFDENSKLKHKSPSIVKRERSIIVNAVKKHPDRNDIELNVDQHKKEHVCEETSSSNGAFESNVAKIGDTTVKDFEKLVSNCVHSSASKQEELKKPLDCKDVENSVDQNIPIKVKRRGRPKKIYYDSNGRQLAKKPSPPSLVCDQCGKSFKNKCSLRDHLRRHTGEKPYMCSTCGKSFHVLNDMKKHSMVHTGVKPYKCVYCEKCFADWGSRFKHERCHRGERPYMCDLCPKQFTYSYVLTRHKLTHLGMKAFSCGACRKYFTLKYHLDNHNKKYHNGLKNEPETNESSVVASNIVSVLYSE